MLLRNYETDNARSPLPATHTHRFLRLPLPRDIGWPPRESLISCLALFAIALKQSSQIETDFSPELNVRVANLPHLQNTGFSSFISHPPLEIQLLWTGIAPACRIVWPFGIGDPAFGMWFTDRMDKRALK